jgi:cytoskeleton protein RodZ
LAAGETVGYTGELPMSVVVGRIEGVAVEIRGQSFSPEPVAGTNVARFEVK